MNARKIPQLRILFIIALFLHLLAAPGSAQHLDSAATFRDARRAVSDFEWAIRRSAPTAPSAAGSGSCDEQVGRFCIIFDTGQRPLPPEPEAVSAARERAIVLLEKAVGLAPDRNQFVFPLLRLLAQAQRPEQALPHARAYARTTANLADGLMVTGFALHQARRTPGAAEALDAWVAALPERERAKVRRLDWLLAPNAEKRLDRLDENGRDSLVAQAWRFADPLLLTPGNELWTDHLARYAASRMLREAPTSSWSSWGSDVEQLTIRFGEPVRTTRTWRSGIGANQSYSEHWDPSQRTYFPPDPETAFNAQPGLDSIWPMDPLVTRSGHAPPTIRVMRVLEHQTAVFGDLVRVSAVVPTDTLVQKVLGGTIFFLDSAFRVLARADLPSCPSCLLADSAMVDATVRLPEAARFYSAEVYDPASRFAARARHPLPRPRGSLSSVLLTRPFEPGLLPDNLDSDRLVPLGRPVVVRGERFGVYVEIANSGRRRSANVALEVRSIDRGSAVGRVAGWVGQKLGITSPRSPARLGWVVELEAEASTPIPVTLDLGLLEPGGYRITMSVDDGAAAGDVVTRDFAVVNAPSPSSRRP